MPSQEAYALARDAALHALALDDRLASAHVALAFADFHGFWDAAAARDHFARVIALAPADATAHHWYATFLMELGRYTEALAQINAARALAPSSPAIAADRALILYDDGYLDDAIATLRALEHAQPNFLSPYNYLAYIAFDRGEDWTFLSQSRAAARLMHDSDRAGLLDAALQGLREGGHAGMARAIYLARVRQYQSGVTGAYAVAAAAGMAGDQVGAMKYLALAFDRRESEVLQLSRDKSFAALRENPYFRRLAIWLEF